MKGICGLTGYDYNANPGYLSAGVNWISPQNDPSNDVSATVAPSASSVTLQFNSLDFAHHEISSNTAISCTGQLQPDSAGNPSCLALNDSQTGLNWGNALVETAGVIDSAVPYINANVSGGQIVGGSIYGCTSTTYVVNISPDGPCAAVNNGGYPGVTPNASPSGTTYKICSHNSTRYWGTNGESNGSSCTSSNPIAFNYIPNGGKWPSSPITIELNVKPANDFKYVTGDKVNTHADPYYPKTKPYVYQCVLAKDQISGHQPFLSSFSTAKIASVCPSANEFFTLNINNTPPPKDHATCPPWDKLDNNGTQVPINTPNQVPAGSAPSQSYGPSGSQYVTNTPSNYTLNSVTATPSNDTTTFTPNQSSTGSFTANYTKFFKDYPYDPENVTANYTETYQVTTYTANGSAVYGPAPCELPYTYNGVPGCSQYGPAPLLGYTYTTSSTTVSKNFSFTQTRVPECYNRHFEISLTSNTPKFHNSNNSSTVENPATVVYKPSVTVTFSANHGGKLINPYTVNGVNTTINAQYHNMSNPSKDYPYPYACSSNPALPITYSDSSTSPGPPDPANSYTITYTCPATIPKLSYGDVACFNIGVDPSSGTMNSEGDIQATSVGLINQPSTGYSCSQPLQAKPYIKVFGGDVLAGLSSSDIASCYNNTASILGFNKGGSGQQGSGTTVADLATGSINGFVSGQNVLNMLDPLTFSNTQLPPSYGGNYGEGGSCGSGIDYYTYAQEIAKNPPLGFTVQQLPNSASIDGLTIPAGSHYIYYAEGNVTINGNITFSHSGVSPSNVPSFELVVKNGNITIGNNVTELDGVYIDEGGTITNHGNSINECNSNPTADYYDQCSKPLIVKGSLIAHTINLYRSYGTYHMSSSSPNPSDPYASEQFIYSPLTWLTPGYSPSPLVQSITSLPPIAN